MDQVHQHWREMIHSLRDIRFRWGRMKLGSAILHNFTGIRRMASGTCGTDVSQRAARPSSLPLPKTFNVNMFLVKQGTHTVRGESVEDWVN